jgi:hypothetical protein
MNFHHHKIFNDSGTVKMRWWTLIVIFSLLTKKDFMIEIFVRKKLCFSVKKKTKVENQICLICLSSDKISCILSSNYVILKGDFLTKILSTRDLVKTSKIFSKWENL